MLVPDVQKYIHKLTSRFPKIKSIWLLGSRANGAARLDSDWDFLAFADAQTFQEIKHAKEFKRPDVDLLVVHNAVDFEEPWPIPTPERPGPKAGALNGPLGWSWSQLSATKANYRATKEDHEPRVLEAVRVWPEGTMQQDFIDRIDEFGSVVKPVQEIWKAIILRAAWFQCEGAPRPIAISIKFTAQTQKQFPKPAHLPEAGPIRISWEVRPGNDLNEILNSLKSGSIQIDGTALKLEYRNGTKWAELNSPYVNFERPGVYYARDREFAEVSMRESQSISDQVYGPIRDRQLDEIWRALPAPYWDRNDVLSNFFEIPGGTQQDQLTLYAHASIPIRFTDDTDFKNGNLTLSISKPSDVQSSKISVGIISSTLDGKLTRSTLSLKSGKHDGIQIKRSFMLGKEIARLTLLLRYGGITLERREVLATGVSTANMTMAAHEALDLKGEFYLESLAGRGKDRGRDFEHAVSWLFTFCGFSVVSYGKLNHFDKRAPDLIATSKKDNLVLAIECTISSPNNEGKLAKLRDRCRDLRNNLKGKFRVIPILATALEDSSIPASDRSLAAQDEILLLPFPHLSQIHGMANAGEPLSKIVSYLRNLRGESKSNLLDTRDRFLGT